MQTNDRHMIEKRYAEREGESERGREREVERGGERDRERWGEREREREVGRDRERKERDMRAIYRHVYIDSYRVKQGEVKERLTDRRETEKEERQAPRE